MLSFRHSLKARERGVIDRALTIIGRTLQSGDAFATPDAVKHYLQLHLAGEPCEQFAALYLNFVLSMLGVPQALASLIKSADVSALVLLWLLAGMYLVLGIALETMPMLVGTLPVVFPITQAVGIDPVFFGVFIVLMCEISLISPPIGMTLYVIQGVRGEGSINDVFQGTLPFFAAMIVMTGILIHFPIIATYLPNLMFGR